MKKFKIKNIKQWHDLTGDPFAELHELEVEGDEDMEISDGYHTMDELYAHRNALFINLLCALKSIGIMQERMGMDPSLWQNCDVWRSQYHSDGTKFDGWFIMGWNSQKGEQMTYHLPMSDWENTNMIPTLDRAPEFDGHTADDVLNRLKFLYEPEETQSEEQA